MEHQEAKQYLENLRARQPELASETKERIRKPLPESRVIRLFARFQAKYTHKWTSAIDDDAVYKLAVADWQEGLAGLTDEQIMIGIAALPKSWPPTSGEFRDLCEQKADDWAHNTKAYKNFDRSKALELKPNKEVAKKHLNEIKQTLGITA